jgi:carboxypeptidase family protein
MTAASPRPPGLLLCLILLSGAGPLRGQGATGSVWGRVTGPERQPLSGLTVSARRGSAATRTDPDGWYRLDGVPAGQVALSFTAAGFKPAVLEDVRVCSGLAVRYDFVMGGGEGIDEIVISGTGDRCASEGEGSTRIIGREEAGLPADRIADLLALEPGVGSLTRGELSPRGAGPNSMSTYLDGVPITPGHRGFLSPLLGGSWFGQQGAGVAVGTNAFEQAALVTGAGPAEFGSARGAVVGVVSRAPESGQSPDVQRPVQLRGSWASDAFFGKSNGLGFNRVTADVAGRSGRFSGALAATVEGQSTARLGMDQNDPPVYLASGVDTTVSYNTPGGARTVSVLQFAPSDGVRIPISANSSYSVLGRVEYQFGSRHRVQLSGVASQLQSREFDYDNLYNPAQLKADRNWSRVLTGSWFGTLRDAPDFGVAAEAHLSWQQDQSVSGPLTASSERASRNPSGGFLLGPLGLRFDGDNFPVNDDLVRNFRLNSGRRSPYDLGNTTQYALVDEFRNNAYGLAGFSESGGPVGLLRLSKESRLLGKVVLDGRIGARQHVRMGGEVEGYDIAFYSSQLVSQQLAEAYVESPSRLALYGDYEFRSGDFAVGAGLRYDRFRSGGSRPVFPRISSAPGFDPANPTAAFVADRAHGRLSPRAHASLQATTRVSVFASAGGMTQLPDFAAVFGGINTDLSVTSSFSHNYGTDLDFEHATLVELGARYAAPGRGAPAVTGTFWHRNDADLVVADQVNELDPLTQTTVSIRRYRNSSSATARGLDLRASRRLGPQGEAWLGYGFADADQRFSTVGSVVVQSTLPRRDVRRHTIVGAVMYESGPATRALGGVLRDTGVYGAVRLTSGTLYTRCAFGAGNRPNLSDGFCVLNSAVGPINGSSLPWTRLVDLRVTRGFRLGAVEMVAFGDVRNLLNTRNVLRVFVQTGRTDNPNLRNDILATDLGSLSSEAGLNGLLLGNGTIDLSFGGAPNPRASCGAWQATGGTPAPPNCIYLIQAEERFGNGDHLFTVAEQTRASDAHYAVSWGDQQLTGPGRRVRFGVEVRW